MREFTQMSCHILAMFVGNVSVIKRALHYIREFTKVRYHILAMTVGNVSVESRTLHCTRKFTRVRDHTRSDCWECIDENITICIIKVFIHVINCTAVLNVGKKNWFWKVAITFKQTFVAMRTNLIFSFNLSILVEATCRPLKLYQAEVVDTQSQERSNWMHSIFCHQRVWWHHCWHSNVGRCQESLSAPLTHSLTSSLSVSLFLPHFSISFLPVIKNW